MGFALCSFQRAFRVRVYQCIIAPAAQLLCAVRFERYFQRNFVSARVLQSSELERLSLTAAESHNSATHKSGGQTLREARDFDLQLQLDVATCAAQLIIIIAARMRAHFMLNVPSDGFRAQQQLLLQFARGS